MDTVTLSLVTEDDLEEIVDLVNHAYRGDEGWATENEYIEGLRTTVASLRADIRSKSEALCLMWRREPDVLLLGSVWLEPASDGKWYLGMLNVRPNLQNQHLGRRLLQAAESRAKTAGATSIRISVINVRDQLICWYQRRGYAFTGERQPFPYGDERFGRPLRDDLEFVFLEKSL